MVTNSGEMLTRSSVVDGTLIVIYKDKYLEISTYISRTEWLRDSKNRSAWEIVETPKIAFKEVKRKKVDGQYLDVIYEHAYNYEALVQWLSDAGLIQRPI